LNEMSKIEKTAMTKDDVGANEEEVGESVKEKITPMIGSPLKKKDDNKKSDDREKRRKKREEMRSKMLGVVGKIDTESKSSKKIKFDDNILEQTEGLEKPADVIAAPDDQKKEEDIENQNDDDDEVEEVKASKAREDALERRNEERNSSLATKKLEKKKKRKRTGKLLLQDEEKIEDEEKIQDEEKIDDEEKIQDEKQIQDEDLDEQFFAQLDTELEEKRQDKKNKKKKSAQPKSKHTTFISDEFTDPTDVGHNISVVVLKSSSLVAPSKPSPAAQVFSKTKIESGKFILKKTKRRRKEVRGWERSRKVNRLMTPQGKAKQQAKPAAHFVINA